MIAMIKSTKNTNTHAYTTFIQLDTLQAYHHVLKTIIGTIKIHRSKSCTDITI